MHDLATIEHDWDEAARQDAFFNILTIHGLSRDAFWEMGRHEIDGVIEALVPSGRGRALDFGCGIGRLTQALAEHFERVDGVDIAREMLSLAEAHSRNPRVHFHHNAAPHLALFASDTFDFVYTSIVLQHMPQPLAEGYVSEFLRVTRTDGIVVFQIPEGHDMPSGALSMYGTPRATVESWLTGHRLLSVETNDASGAGYTSYRYTVRVR
jgi:ubiquinone/menaquinone biosynthesis C-methylase UbiE